MPRRDFVKVSVGAMVAARLPDVRLAPKVRFAYSAITWGGNDTQAIIDVSSLGFPGIQLRSNLLPEYVSKTGALRDLLAKHRLTFVILSSGAVGVDPSLRTKTIDDHVDHARFVRDTGGLYLQLTDERPRGRAVTPDDIARLGDIMSEIGRRSSELGITVAYHNHMGSIGEGPEAIDGILAASDARHVKLLLDVAHYHQGGGDSVAAIRRHRDRLLLLHLKDVESPAPGGNPRSYRFVELGRGRVDLKGVFTAMADVGFDGWAVVELDAVPDKAVTPREAGVTNKKFLEAAGFRVEE